MKAIVAVSKNWGIGNKNELLYYIPEDMKRFKELTTGNTIVMGRKTLESFPGGRPLPNRKNIVITTDKNYDGKGAVVVNSIEEFLNSPDNNENTFVIGGGSIYKSLLPYTDTVLVTRIYGEKDADTFFENLDALDEFEISDESDDMQSEGLTYRFITYKRKKK